MFFFGGLGTILVTYHLEIVQYSLRLRQNEDDRQVGRKHEPKHHHVCQMETHIVVYRRDDLVNRNYENNMMECNFKENLIEGSPPSPQAPSQQCSSF